MSESPPNRGRGRTTRARRLLTPDGEEHLPEFGKRQSAPCDQLLNHFLIECTVAARPARAMDVVRGISFGQTATQF